jgi:GH15 family glucan-1,4-alpha-glucosidase
LSQRIEDYALIGDLHTCALVGRNGSIDWLCVPRVDSEAVFAGLLGDNDNGHWTLAPTDAGSIRSVRRRYRGETLVLETDFETDTGLVRVVDAMPPRVDSPVVVRLVHGVRGRVGMSSTMRFRFDYGKVTPWVRRVGEDGDRITEVVAGPNAIALRSSVPLEGRDMATVADFEIRAGQTEWFVLAWHPSHLPAPSPVDAVGTVDETEAWWAEWIAGCTYDGGYQDAVRRSLVTLKALTYAPTGGVVAAPTASLPEQIGGVRNWDYRYCWLRDTTFTLLALLYAGFEEEAGAWREWLLRAIAGDPKELQIMYGVAGERRLAEYELPWLSGYEGSAPVRIGNAAVDQFQLDVWGEVMDALHVAREVGMHTGHSGQPADADASWPIQTALMDFLEGHWQQPDDGIWEVRGPQRHFVHSKVMAWVAADRAVQAVRRSGLPGPVERWEALRTQIHEEVCAQGFDAERGTFTQSYGSKELDASVLLVPLVGFLPASDPRVSGTVAAIERELMSDGFVRRYSTSQAGGVDGLPSGEGAFLACTFWLADNHVLAGRTDRATELFESLLDLRNDVGLLAEEYDPQLRRQVGNFPQAFSHVPLVNTARNLSDHAAGREFERRTPTERVRGHRRWHRSSLPLRLPLPRPHPHPHPPLPHSRG